MARSIHTTRRRLTEHLADRYADADIKRARTDELHAELGRKWRIKWQRRAERRSSAPPAAGVATDIEIVVEDGVEHAHHGATPEELRAVLARFPPGAAEGISKIVLGLGLHDRREDYPGRDPDPYTGRPSVEVWPGVYSGGVLGTYAFAGAEVFLSAFVYDAGSLANRRIKELLIKLSALSTFAHELGHHHDRVARVARGRWLADDRDKREAYAERVEHAWTHEVVVPYLEEAHAEEVAHLRAWLRAHGGLDVPLAMLVDDPRTTRADGKVAFIFPISSALEQLLEDVEAGKDPTSCRVSFARDLHYRDEYALPRSILDAILVDDPSHVEALTLSADIDVHEGALAMAESRCRQVLAAAPDHVPAWLVLGDAMHDARRWHDVVAATTTALALELDAGDLHALLALRSRALLELGDDERLEADLRALALGSRYARSRARALRAVQLLWRGRLDEALDLAVTGITTKGVVARPELFGVRFEAALRLGRPEVAGELTGMRLERLERLGYDSWVVRLRELGAG